MSSALNGRTNSVPHTGIKKHHVCPVKGCETPFSRPYRLKQHLLVHENVKGYKCSESGCQKSYSNKSHLDRHVKNTHCKDENDILYSCPTCFKNYANRQNLKRHIKLSHVLKTLFRCDVCKESFRKKHQLSTHLYKHTGVKAFNCEHCPQDFISLFEKKKHMRGHKTYTCETCKAIFNQWSKYQKHLKTEHDPKEFICNDCDRKFKQRVHMVRHFKQKSCSNTETIFPCPYEKCERSYKRNSNLRQHILINHENLRFLCSFCDTTLSTKAKLKQHIQNFHEKAKIKDRVAKTLESGRRYRKDKGSIKVYTALKLSGIKQDAIKNAPILLKHDVQLALTTNK